ncbi:MAG: flavin reductase family protein [Thaumarchaeota archaeon]|nr:flavin reductase family protein [Nitrososphaerota archaeon]
MSAGGFVNVPLLSAYHLLHPKPAILVISADAAGRVNGMIAAWTTPLSHSPPLIGVSISPKRYTYELVKESGEFTLNIMSKEYAKQIHFLGTVSGRDRKDKLRESGLTISKSKKVKAPHVEEALAVLECRVEKEVEAGDHVFFIARILEAYAKSGVFDEVYKPEKAKILLHLGAADYVTISDETIRP